MVLILAQFPWTKIAIDNCETDNLMMCARIYLVKPKNGSNNTVNEILTDQMSSLSSLRKKGATYNLIRIIVLMGSVQNPYG